MAWVEHCGDGSRLVRAYAGVNPTTGRPRKISERLPPGASDADVEDAATRIDALAAEGKGDSKMMTVGALLEHYMGLIESDGLSPTTIKSYRSYLRCHIAPCIGQTTMDTAGPRTFSAFYSRCRTERGLAQTTVHKMHSFMSGAFSRLARDGYIERSPVMGMRVSPGRHAEAAALTKADMGTLMAYLRGTIAAGIAEGGEEYVLACVWWTALHTGLRRGELSALMCDDLYLGDNLRVDATVVSTGDFSSSYEYREPKSERSRRRVALDEATVEVIEGCMAAEDGAYGAGQPMFRHADGTLLLPDELSAAFSDLARRLGLEKRVHLHTLRHTHATWLIQSGMDFVTVQERLGHASAAVTMDMYSHVMPGRDRKAAESFAEMSGGIAHDPPGGGGGGGGNTG